MTCSGRPVNLEVLLGEIASGTVYVRMYTVYTVRVHKVPWLQRALWYSIVAQFCCTFLLIYLNAHRICTTGTITGNN